MRFVEVDWPFYPNELVRPEKVVGVKNIIVPIVGVKKNLSIKTDGKVFYNNCEFRQWSHVTVGFCMKGSNEESFIRRIPKEFVIDYFKVCMESECLDMENYDWFIYGEKMGV